MMINRLISCAVLILCAAFVAPASASGASPAGTSTLNYAAYFAPIHGLGGGYSPDSPPVIGADGAYYLVDRGVSQGSVLRVATDGSLSDLYTFSMIPSYDPVTGLGFNSDGARPTQLYLGPDGNFYGQTSIGGAYGFGTLFRVTPGGVLTTLHTFDDRSQIPPNTAVSGDREVTMAKDGTLYGLDSVMSNSPALFKLTPDGTYTTICSAAIPGFVNETFDKLIAGSDGNFYGLLFYVPPGTDISTQYTAIFKLTPDCRYSQIYVSPTGDYLTSLIQGNDGNFYVVDPDFQNGGAVEQVLKVTPAGQATPLASFNLETQRAYVPGRWICEGLWCSWYPGYWATFLVTNNASGFEPDILMQARDGSINGATFYAGLNGTGTIFRIGADGSFSTLLSTPANTNQIFAIIEDNNSNLLAFGVSGSSTIPGQPQAGGLIRLAPNAPLTTHISFSIPSVRLYQPTVLSWSSTQATSCQLISDIKGVGGSVATSGSKTVKLTTTQMRTPASFVAGLQCVAADGSISNASATVTVQ